MPSEAELRANRRAIGIYRAPTVYPNRRGLVLLSQKENKLRENPQRQPACTQRELEGGHPHAGVRTLPAPRACPTEQTWKPKPWEERGRGAGRGGGGRRSQRGRLAGAVAAQEGGDVALVEVQVEPPQGWSRVAVEPLLQAPDGDPRNQAGRSLFH